MRIGKTQNERVAVDRLKKIFRMIARVAHFNHSILDNLLLDPQGLLMNAVAAEARRNGSFRKCARVKNSCA